MNQFKNNNVIKPRELQLKDDNYLQSLTFTELGLILEYEFHTDFHVRFSDSKTMGMRSQSVHPTAWVNPKWDVLKYDFLGDFYSVHVNICFWKIHGWIKKVISSWQTSRSITTIQFSSTLENSLMNDVVFEQLTQIAVRVEERQNNAGSDDSVK